MKRIRRHAKQGLVLTAGAAMAGAAACDDGTVVCDPPPPPLCDALDVDSSLRLEANPTSAALDELIEFTGGIDSTGTAMIQSLEVYAEAGRVVQQAVIGSDSLSFTWSPREVGGGFQSGTHEIRLRLYMEYEGKEGGRSCVEQDTARVSIDEAGNATVLSLPGSSALGTYFRVTLQATNLGGTFLLRAGSSLPPDRSKDLVWTWRWEGGTLVPDGNTARFTPGPGGSASLVQVEGRLGTRGLAVASWRPME